MGTLDARLVALDAGTGAVRWEVEDSDPDSAYAITMAPLVTGGSVIVGAPGAEYATRGRLTAYDVRTGQRLWRFHTVPSPEEGGWWGRWSDTTSGGDGLGRQVARERSDSARYADAWRTGGGAVWTTPAYDAELGLIYFGTGNPYRSTTRLCALVTISTPYHSSPLRQPPGGCVGITSTSRTTSGTSTSQTHRSSSASAAASSSRRRPRWAGCMSSTRSTDRSCAGLPRSCRRKRVRATDRRRHPSRTGCSGRRQLAAERARPRKRNHVRADAPSADGVQDVRRAQAPGPCVPSRERGSPARRALVRHAHRRGARHRPHCVDRPRGQRRLRRRAPHWRRSGVRGRWARLGPRLRCPKRRGAVGVPLRRGRERAAGDVELEGEQFVAVAAGGSFYDGRLGDAVLVFGLPQAWRQR